MFVGATKFSKILWAFRFTSPKVYKTWRYKHYMFLEILLAILLGILAGIITGLTPGIHINLISVMLLSVSPVLLKYTNPIALAVFIIAMSVTHTFLDAIPSIFLGAPESATALGVLPGHRYLLKGYGLMAVSVCEC